MVSVEISGPKGYEYQYLVTALSALQNFSKENISLIVEKDGGEDFEIIYTENNQEIVVECQVKRTISDLNLQNLLNWIHHFPDRRYDQNLLSRIENDTKRYAKFITKGRCTDDTKNFISYDISPHCKSPLNSAGVKQYLKLLPGLIKSETTLKRKRSDFNSQQHDRFLSNPNHFNNTLKRILVEEKMEEEDIISQAYKIMNKELNIPQGICEKVLLFILESIRTARDQRSNVMPHIQEIIKANKVDYLHYGQLNVDRDITPTLYRNLTRNNCLLLTGLSFCGKTHMARSIGNEYQKKGYYAREVQDIYEARRFLLEDVNEERVCILEDPLGHSQLSGDSPEIWSELSDLILKLNPGKLLIVTSKIEVLKEHNSALILKDCSIGNIDWFDLTVSDKEFMKLLWQQYLTISKNGYTDDLNNKISNLLENQEKFHLLQPGQVRYLALEKSNSELLDMTEEAIIKEATIDSEKISKYFNSLDPYFKKIIFILGLGATTLNSISINEIAYIVSEKETEYPSAPWEYNKGESILALENTNGKKPKFPEYEEEYSLANNYLEILEYLETRGYIYYSDNSYFFSHPTFRNAALQVLIIQGRHTQRTIASIVKKGISSLDYTVCINFIKQFKSIYKRATPETKKTYIEYSKTLLKSLFPAVRDEALIFLLSIFGELDKANQEYIFNRLKSTSFEDKLLWHNGKPWINPKEYSDLSDFRRYLLNIIPVEENKSEILKKKIEREKLYSLSTEEIWEFVTSYVRYNDDIESDINIFLKLLNTNESFIRAKLAKLLLENVGFLEKAVENVFSDPHPSVVYQGIRGMFNGWGSYDEKTKKNLTNVSLQALEKVPVAIVSHSFFLNFGDKHGFDSIEREELNEQEEQSVWKLWASLFPTLLKNVEGVVAIREPHLDFTVGEASKILASNDFIPVINAWMEWIEYYLPKNLLSDYGYSVVSPLLLNTGSNSLLRKKQLRKLLSYSDTSYIAVTLSETIRYWHFLSEEEKSWVLDLINCKRIDQRWIKAIALTRYRVPDEIQNVTLGSDTLKQTPELIINELDEKLMADCLHVYFGHPQPLWWIGTHHSSTLIWKDISLSLLERCKKEHPGFKIALREFIDDYSNSDYPNQDIGIANDIFNRICNSVSGLDKQRIFYFLLNTSKNIVGVEIEYLWDIFFKSCEKKEKEQYLEVIAENANHLTDKNRLTQIFSKDSFWNDILPHLKTDMVLFKLMSMSWDIEATSPIKESQKEVLYPLLDMLKGVYQTVPPKLILTDKLILKYLNRIDSEDLKKVIGKLEEIIKQVRLQLLEESRNYEFIFDDHFELEGWNYNHK